MIRVTPPPEPAAFDVRCRRPGNAWLATHPTGRPRDCWTPFQAELAAGFANRCGYKALWDLDGTVDHYLSCKNHRGQAYEWGNYRHASGSINSSKGTHDAAILDPFHVQDDWFVLDLLTMRLLPTTAIPAHERTRADFTLKQLKLQNGSKVKRQRQKWYDQFKAGRFGHGPSAVDNLRVFAPQVAAAIERWQTANPGQALP